MTIYTHTHLILPCQPPLFPYILFKNFCIFGLPWWFQWLTLHASTAGGTGSNPSQRTKSLHAKQHSQEKKKHICSSCNICQSEPIRSGWTKMATKGSSRESISLLLMLISHIWYKGIVHNWSDFAPNPRGILAHVCEWEMLLTSSGERLRLLFTCACVCSVMSDSLRPHGLSCGS